MSKKWKVGDRVRRINHRFGSLFPGDIATVTISQTHGVRVAEDDGQYLYCHNEFELVEPAAPDAKRICSLFDLEEGKVYESLHYKEKRNHIRYRVKEGILQEHHPLSAGYATSHLSVSSAVAKEGFQEITDQTLSVPGLDYELVRRPDGSLKVGCQEIPKESVERIKEFLA